jgi:predicted dehydrogenase
VIISPRNPPAPARSDIPVDPALLAAGDHNGSTFYQHRKFVDAVRGNGHVEVTLNDGMWAVRMGQAAQRSAIEHQPVPL